jgi:UDP-N-acetylglucosamine--N-acetylmuramyl-(pentapeptide) pyrophosphoryl-undecaprenol N-acetylglucosamine transferase
VSTPTILIAGGGTGGHVFPALAVAEAMRVAADVDVVFCGTSRGAEVRLVPPRGWALELLDVEPMMGAGALRAIRGAVVAARAMGTARRLVRRIRPRAVLSVGGYAAGPVTLAAALQGVPVAVLEPNRVVGLANRMLGPLAKRAYVASEAAAMPFSAGARRLYGVPLRAGFVPRPYVPNDTCRILVIGGSQGAAALNERMPEAIGRLSSTHRVEVIHQAGHDRDAAVRLAYASAGVAAVRVVGFVEDVARTIAEADLVVARAGAGTIAEITAVGRASLLVPFPYAAGGHQARNGESLSRIGAALCLGQEAATPSRLAQEIGRLLSDARARVTMADAARAAGRPDAARDVAADLLALAGIVAGMDAGRRTANGPVSANGRAAEVL